MCAVMFFFFFQAEDGIRDYKVTGVQTCALPIFAGLFALLGLGVAVVGLFGLLSYSVSLRGREFGIRMAIGARPQDVQRLVVRQGMMLVAFGVIAGVAGALVATRAVAGMLYGIEATDPLTFVAVPVALALVSLIACY